MGYSPWSLKELDTSELLKYTIINPRKQGRDFFFSCGRSFFFSSERRLEVSRLKRLVLWFHGAVSGLGSLSQASIFKVTFLHRMAARGIAVTSHSQQQERREKEGGSRA